jgi:hypothetical protein
MKLEMIELPKITQIAVSAPAETQDGVYARKVIALDIYGQIWERLDGPGVSTDASVWSLMTTTTSEAEMIFE